MDSAAHEVGAHSIQGVRCAWLLTAEGPSDSYHQTPIASLGFTAFRFSKTDCALGAA